MVFRTGDVAEVPTVNTPYTSDADLPYADESEPQACYYLEYLKTMPGPDSSEQAAAVLRAEDFQHHVDYFNAMEEETVVQAIPNDQSWDWMKKNVPLFECPQRNFEQMYYYRWWTLRKHIKTTPLGYAMTEFLVDRPYADRYNLIACAVGHHIYESRWLRDRQYVNQYLRIWFRGNEGQPMPKLRKFSSWIADALYNKYLVDGDRAYLLDLYPDLRQEFTDWDDHLLDSGLYWQGDVQDGMEESISGGRKKQYARPTINSYMYGNAVALSGMAALAGDSTAEKHYSTLAKQIKILVLSLLWNPESSFFETLRAPGEWAQVREAIGYIPWYFNLPDADPMYGRAWEQVTDERGFLAPYGLTTAERRHPEFRTHGCCKCEWDGAVWPFASSQTLTAMGNYMNSTQQPVVSKESYFRLMEMYVESQYHRGRPYVGEYLDETTGGWLKGDQERSRYYNHSTFNDLIITGLIGLRPRHDNTIEIRPLIPENQWDWFCLDQILYRGHTLTLVWDRNGSKYGLGRGFRLLIDGHLAMQSDHLDLLITNI